MAGGVSLVSADVAPSIEEDAPPQRNGKVEAKSRRNDAGSAGAAVYESVIGQAPAKPVGDRPRPSVSVVIPAFNEEESIDWVLEQLPPWVYEVVLIDGLSTDRTEAIARRLRPDIVVVHQRQRGKGAALRAGFAAARGDIIVMLDADGSTDPRELERFVAALEAGADFVKGSRTAAGGGSADLTPLRRTGNLGFVTLVNLLYGSHFTDLCYGYCAFWRQHLASLALAADGFEIETELVLNAVEAGLKIREVPSVELPRRGGASNLHAFRDGSRVLKRILRHRFARGPQAQAASFPIELVALSPAGAQVSTAYLALAQPRAAASTESPRWLNVVRTTATSRNGSVAGAARTALPWALSTVLLVRQRTPTTARERWRKTPTTPRGRRRSR
jgi:glycosyl transferase family 2